MYIIVYVEKRVNLNMCTALYPQSEEDSHALLQNRALNTENESLKRDVHLLKEMIETIQEELIREQAHHKITQSNLSKAIAENTRASKVIKKVKDCSRGAAIQPEVSSV